MNKKEKFVARLKYGVCFCCGPKSPGTDPHECTYAIQVYHHYALCNCCKDCTQICDDDFRGK